MSHDFDRRIDRRDSQCEKYDGMQPLFGRSDLTPLWVADMDFAPPPAVYAALRERVDREILGYSFAQPSLFEAIQAWCNEQHHWQPERDSLVLTPGVVPGLFAAIQALTQPGDGVIVMPPVYPPLFKSVELTQRQLLLNPLLREGDSYRIHWQQLEMLAPQARMLLFCSPHNPVGRVWQREELERLLDIAQRHDLIIVSDEIHADLCFKPHTVLATLPGADRCVITAMAPSKTFNIPGLNLAWMSVPKAIQRKAIQQVFSGLGVQVNNPLSLVAAEAAYRHGADWRRDLLRYLRTSHDALLTAFPPTNAGPRALPMQSTYLLWLDCRHLGQETEVMHTLVNTAQVALSKGSFFGQDGLGYMRLNYAAPRTDVLAACTRINAAFNKKTP